MNTTQTMRDYMKEYNQRPEVIAHRKAYNKKRRTDPAVKAHCNELQPLYKKVRECNEILKFAPDNKEILDILVETKTKIATLNEKFRNRNYPNGKRPQFSLADYQKKYYNKPEVKAYYKETAPLRKEIHTCKNILKYCPGNKDIINRLSVAEAKLTECKEKFRNRNNPVAVKDASGNVTLTLTPEQYEVATKILAGMTNLVTSLQK